MALYKASGSEQIECSNKIDTYMSELRLKNTKGGFIGRSLIKIWYQIKDICLALFIISIVLFLISMIIFFLASIFKWNDKIFAGSTLTMFASQFYIMGFIVISVIRIFASAHNINHSETPYSIQKIKQCTMRQNEYIEITNEGITIKYLESRKRSGGSKYSYSSPACYKKIELDKNHIYGIIHSSELGIYIIAGISHKYMVSTYTEYPDYSYVNMPWEPVAGTDSDKCIIIIENCENTETGMKDVENSISTCLDKIIKEVDSETATKFIWNTDKNFSSYVSGMQIK